MIKNMSISTSSMSVEKQFMPENRVQQVELLNSINDLHGGVVVNIEQPMDSKVFSPLLRASISQWRQKVYIVSFNLISLSPHLQYLLDVEISATSYYVKNLGCNLQGKRGVWIKLPIEHANLVEAAIKVSTFIQCRLYSGLAQELILNVELNIFVSKLTRILA